MKRIGPFRAVPLSVAALALLAGPAAAAAETPGESIAEIRRSLDEARLAPSPFPEGTPPYRRGHLEVELGATAYPLVAGGRVVGAFFREGHFTYRSASRFEARTFPTNLDRVTRLELGEGGLADGVRSGLILDAAIGSQLSVGEPGAGEAPEEVRKALAKHRERFGRDRVATANRVAQAILEGEEARVAVVQLDTGRDDLLYFHDGLREGRETLSALELYPGYHQLSGQRYPALLSDQPLGEPLERWPRRFVLTHLDVKLVNRAERELELELVERFEALRPVRTLGLELWNDRVTADDVLPFELRSAALEDGSEVPFSQQDDDLVVQLPDTLEPGETVSLRFRISGDALYRPGGHSFWWLPIASWFPRPPRLDQASFTYHAVVKAAAPFVPFSMGEIVRRWEEEGLNCVETRLERPVQFPVILAGDYHTYSETRDGFTIHLASYAFSHDRSMQKIAHNLFELQKLYEILLGEFPFDQLQVLEINSYGFGVAPPGVIYLTREAFDPSPRGRSFREELNLRMAHEMAHQYWGHVAQMSSWEDQWLSESTAEYYGAVAVGKLLGEREMRQAIRAWKEQSGLVRDGVASIYTANRVSGEKAGRNRYALLYGEGPLMLHDLRRELGDQAFFTVFKSFLTNFRFQHVETEKLIQITNYITGEDYRPWFEERLFGFSAAR